MHKLRLAAEHSAQVLSGPTQSVLPSMRPAQCASVPHSAQTAGGVIPARWTQRGSIGVLAMQSLSVLQLVVQLPIISALVDVQNCPLGQVLPVVPPRHPGRHRCAAESHTRPDIRAPQSASVTQPQTGGSIMVAPGRHAAPVIVMSHDVRPPVAPGTQGTHRRVAGLHAGVAPTQAARLAGVHTTH